LARPWPLKFLFDDVLTEESLTTGDLGSVQYVLVAVAVAIAGIAILDGVLGFLQQYVLRAAGQKVAFRLRVALFGQMQRLPLSYHDRQRTGDLITRVTKDVEKVQDLVTQNIVDASSNFLTLAGMLIIMFLLDWQLSLAMLGLAPLLALATGQYRRRVKLAEGDVRRKEGDIASLAQETISSIRLVKAFGREGFETDRFEEHSGEALDANLRVTRTEAAFSAIISVLTALALAALVWLGAQRVISGHLSLGTLVVFIQYLRDFYSPIRTLSKLSGHVSRTMVRAEKIAEVLQEEPTVKDRPDAQPAPSFTGHIQFEDVGFGYIPGHPIIFGASFDVRPGQVVALVGPTGAGKSTMAALIPRLYDPTEGRVLIDGTDIREYKLASLQSQLSFVQQNSVLFRASIRENIAYGRPEASFDEIVAAAKIANAHEFIMALPDGYDTVVGERGETISGGQRQRIAIARAVVRNAPILILDEPTTGLDARSERMVLDALDHLMEGRTTIIIAHKLATVRRADLILVVEGGRIAESGSHQELAALGGRYAELCSLQEPAETAMSGGSAAEPKREDGRFSEPVGPPSRPTNSRAPRRRDRRIQQHREGADSVSASERTGLTASNRDDLPVEAARKLSEAYDVGDWIQWHRTPKGSSNVSFFVTTSAGKYVLRRSNSRKSAAAVDFEVELIDYLRGKGYPAPEPVRTRSGEGYLEIDGTIYMMTAFIPGGSYDPDNQNHLLAAGRGLGLYHRLVREFPDHVNGCPASALPDLGPKGVNRLAEVDRFARGFLSAPEHNHLSDTFSYIRSQFTGVHRGLVDIYPRLGKLVIQGSFGRSALIFDGDDLTGVVDYDRATVEVRGIDLAYTIKAFCRIHDESSEDYRVGLDHARSRDFLVAYKEVEPLPDQEIEVLPLIFRAQRLAKVLNKCDNLLTKNAVLPQEEKDVRKVATMAEREAVRLRWLEERSNDLLETFTN